MSKQFSRLDKASIFLVSCIIFSIITITIANNWLYHYQGISYVSFDLILTLTLILCLIYLGSYLLFQEHHPLLSYIKRFCLIFAIVSLIVLYTNAIQLTPFPAIDQNLLKIDQLLKIDSIYLLKFTHQYSWLYKTLTFSYHALNYELTIVLLLMIIFYEPIVQSRIVFLLISSAFIGFSIYYFYPTTAPASMLSSGLFSNEQQQTYIKFYKIHNYLKVNNISGGLIAMPSFHCIWALICQYYFFNWRLQWFGYLILPLNFCIITACLLLGWHYFIDLIISFFIVISLIILIKRFERSF